jgi:uncharacterized protein YhaN
MTDDLKARLRGSCYLAFEDGTNDYGSAPDAADRIEELEEALTHSQAEVAAAYERAAVLADYFMQTCMDQETDPEVLTGYGRGMYFCAKQYQTEIRALATPDQTTALDTIRAEAREQGMRDAAGIAYEAAHNTSDISKIRDAILAAITKGGA